MDLLCYFKEGEAGKLARAFRGQEVTVTGTVVGPFDVWEVATLKLENCEFVLGAEPTGDDVVPASRGRGQADAERDIKAGKLRQRFRHGGRADAPPWFARYRQMLHKRGVEAEVKPEVGPIRGLPPDDREYNEVMKAEIEKKLGAGALDKLRKLAEEGREK